MPRHYLDPDDAPGVIDTPYTIKVRDDLEYALARSGIIAVTGDAGHGKTWSVQLASEQLEVRASWATFRHRRTTMRGLADALLRQVTGMRHRGTADALTDTLIDELVGGRLLVVDESHFLSAECLHYLRYLHDHADTRFTLVLVGGPSCWQVLANDPMLHSRIVRHTPFGPLAERFVVQVIPQWHRIYERATREQILRINDNCGHGVLRDWCVFTDAAVAACREHDKPGVDDDIIDIVLWQLGRNGTLEDLSGEELSGEYQADSETEEPGDDLAQAA